MNTQLHQLKAQNPGVSLGTHPLHDAAALRQLDWRGLEAAALLPTLMAYQRLWRLCPDGEVVELLLAHGLGSAHQIAAWGLAKLQDRVGAALRQLRPQQKLAADIHAAAVQTTAAVAQYAVHAIPSDFVSAARFSTRTSGLPDFHGDSATYRALFGPIAAGPCNDCESIFSPAAYYVDLMQLIEEYITAPSGAALAPALQLGTRRPDLWQLMLNCENTAKELPYLQLANDIMASTLKPYLQGTDPWSYAAAQSFPFQLPYNKPLEEIRAYLAHFGLSLHKVYAALDRPVADVAREGLGLVPEAFTQLGTVSLPALEADYGVGSVDELEKTSTFLSQTGLSATELQDLLYQGMNRPVVAANIRNGANAINCGNAISQLPLTALTIECWVKLTTLDMVGDIVGTSPIATSAGFGLQFNYSKLYFNLSDGTQMPPYAIDFSPTDWTHIAAVWDGSTGDMPIYVNGELIYTNSSTLHSIPGTETSLHIGNQPSGGTSYDGCIAQLRIWSVARSQADIQRTMNLGFREQMDGLIGNWPLDEGVGLLVNDYGPYHSQGLMAGSATNSNWIEGPLLPLIDFARIPSLLSQYYLNASLTDAYITVEEGDSGLSIATYNGSTHGTVGNAGWAALNTLIRLSSRLGWTYADLDWTLKAIAAPQPGHWTEADMERLGGVSELHARLGQPLDALAGLWHDLKTYGKGSGSTHASLWDQTFNTPSPFVQVAGKPQGTPYRPQYSANPYFTDDIVFIDTAGTDPDDTQLRLSLSQSLSTTEPDMTAILAYVCRNSAALIADGIMETVTAPPGVTLTDTMIGLSVKNMTLIYRLARLPQWLGLSVAQFLELLPVMGMVGCGSVADALRLEAETGWLKRQQLSAWGYGWLMGKSQSQVDASVSVQQREALEKSLLAGSQATMLLPRQLESETVSKVDALEIYGCLVMGNVIDERGLVLSERRLDGTTVASALAQSAALRQKYRLTDPEQRVITFSGSSANGVQFPLDIAADPDVISSNSFTIACWFRATQMPASGIWSALFSSPTDTDPSTGEGSNGYKSPQLTLTGNPTGQYQAATATADHHWLAYVASTQTPVFSPDAWYHIAWVNDGGTWSVYIDGELSATPWNTGQTTLYANETNTSNLGSYLHGQVAALNLWSRPLSQAEVQLLMTTQPDADTTGLIGSWPMNEGQGTALIDRSAQQRNGTLENGTWQRIVPNGDPAEVAVVQWVLGQVVAAKERQSALALQKLAAALRMSVPQMRGVHALTVASLRSSLVIDGEDAWVEVPYIADLATTQFSVSAWVNVWANTDAQQGIVANLGSPDGTTDSGFALLIDDEGLPVLQLASGSSYVSVKAGDPVAYGKWQAIAATYDGSTASLYVNGVLAKSQAVAAYVPVAGATILGGLAADQVANALDGAIADVRLYGTALSASDVLADMQQAEPLASGLKAWWPLSAGSGDTAYDWSGNGYHGSLQAGTGAATWHNLHVNALLQADSGVDLAGLLQGLVLNATLARKFALDTPEMLGMLALPTAFGMAGPVTRGYAYTPAVLHDLALLKGLKAAHPAAKDQWLLVLASSEAGDDDAAIEVVATVTGWTSTQVELVLDGVPSAGLTTLSGLWSLVAVLDMATRLGVQPSFLVSLGQLSHLPATGSSTVGTATTSNWSIYNGLAAAMADALQAQYSKDELQSALGKVQGALWEKERDVLAALLIHFLKGVVNGVDNLQALYEYLLVDVKMASNVMISRIEQALDGLQLYVNRCINGLEPGAVCKIPKAWWAWMGSYRLWQANREVYLYPENYADPSLRKAQTPLFKSFTNALNQGQLTSANIEKAQGQYLEGMAVVANLEVVDSHARKLTGSPSGGTGTELYVLGRNRQNPPTYYLRRGFLAESQPAAWTPWEQLDFSIGAEYATCIYAFNRLYVFWVQQTSMTVQDPSDTNLQVVEATLYFTHQKLDGSWLQPQTLLPGLPISVMKGAGLVNPQAMYVQGWEPGVAGGYTNTPAWQRVWLQSLPATATEDERLLIQYGDWIRYNTSSAAIDQNVPSPTLTGEAAKAWNKMLGDAYTYAVAITGAYWTSIFPTVVLTEDGRRSPVQVKVSDTHSGNLVAAMHYSEARQVANLTQELRSLLMPRGPIEAIELSKGWHSSFYSLDVISSGYLVDEFALTKPVVRTNCTPAIAVVSMADWNGNNRNVLSLPGTLSGSAYTDNDSTLNFKDAVTVAAWVYPKMDYTAKQGTNTLNYAWQIVFGNQDSSGYGGYAFGLYQGSESSAFQLAVRLGQSGQIAQFLYNVPTTDAIALNHWYHIAFTWQHHTGEVSAYLNGSALPTTTETTFAQFLSGYGAYCSIGETEGFEGYFGGCVSELLVTEACLTATEIQALYTGNANLLSSIPSKQAAVTVASNRTGIYFADTGTETFLCLPSSETGFAFVQDNLTVTDLKPGELELQYSAQMYPSTPPGRVFHRFGTKAVGNFFARLADGGSGELLQLSAQYFQEPAFGNYGPNPTAVTPPTGVVDFDGPMREYLWELFFHMPLYVANLLQTQQQFSLARTWYEYVFDPADALGLVGSWPLDGNLRATTGIGGKLTGSGTPWVETTFVDGSTRTVFNALANGISLDPSMVPLGETVSVTFWIHGNFPTTNYGLDNAILYAHGTPPGSTNDTHVLGIFLLYGSTSTSAYWEAGNDGTGWNEVYSGDSPDDYNGRWHSMAFTKNTANGSLKVYLDGKLWFSTPYATKGIDFPPTAFSVNSGYNAYITELSIWSKELSAEEVQAAHLLQAQNYWKFRPFLETAPATLAQTLTEAPAQLQVYHYDPFDPDALAAIRWGAWEKNVFMAYIRNLIGWGDALFAGDTWENVSEATMLYVVADSLLGMPPKRVGRVDTRPQMSYGMMEARYGEGDIPEFLIDMETRVAVGGKVTEGMASILNGYFCIPENEQLTQLWGIVANRLYKIRHGLNLQGQPSQPSLFGPPLSPAALVDGGAYGASGPGAGSAPQVPYYRFEQMIQLAKSFTSQVVALGNELLAALEKQDGETLAQLRQTQESAILNMTLQAKADMVNQLLSTQQGLEYSLQSAQAELDTISGWAAQVLLPQEALALDAGAEAMALNIGVAAIKAASSIAYLIPDIFGLADGGMDFGDSVKVLGEAMATTAQLLNEAAALNKEVAGYIRREQEWELRIQTIGDSIGQINAQIAANQYAIAAAQQDYAITQTQYQQSQDVLNFLETKFTNEDLYVWMAGQLSTLYYQAYQMALELAQQAQTCYQYELSSGDTFITGDPWNDQYKGLLAGDALNLGLLQMEKAYHDNNSRYQQIHKTYSLMQKDPQALLQLKKNGSCTFSLSELDFDLDFPGHYNRKIASISVTIPAVVGPYQNLNATLIQTGNQVLTKPDIAGVKFMLGQGDEPQNGCVRSNWAPNQQISISTGVNDAGLFQLNFNDPQYLPFEGTGAVSKWELIMPKAANAFDFAAITDVLFQLSYTASPGGQTFARQVTQLPQLQSYRGTLYLSLRQQYASAWYAFLGTYRLNFDLLRAQFPVNLATDSLSLGKDGNAFLALVLATPGDYGSLPAMSLNGAGWDPATGAAAIGAQDDFSNGSKVSWNVVLDFANGGSDLLDGDRIDPAQLLDIVLVVPFGGDLDWGN